MQDLQCSRLSNTIYANQTEYLPRPRRRQSMKFKSILAKPMCCLFVHVLRDIHYLYSLERAFLNTYPATNTEFFSYFDYG